MSSSGAGSVNRSRLKRKNAPGSRVDKGWDHGVDIDGNSKRVQCKYCKKIFTGGIYRLKHHLACTHENVEACMSVPDNVKKEFMVALSQLADRKKKKNEEDDIDEIDEDQQIVVVDKGKGKRTMDAFTQKLGSDGIKLGNKQSTLNSMLKKELREEACQSIARFFYTSAIPFNATRNPEFSKMFELAIRHGPGFKVPSYHEIREKYLKKEVANTTCLLEEHNLEWKKTGCSVMSDGWSDMKRRSIVNFLVNSSKGTVFLSSLDTSNVSKTAEVVYKMLDDIIEKVGEENVVQVVTDNAANYRAAGEMLMEKRKKLYWTPYAAHCIDLILEDFEKKVWVHHDTIEKGKKITTFIYGRSLLLGMMRHFTKRRELARPGPTRFATSYLTLGSLNDHRAALMTMFMSDEWKRSKYASTNEGKKVHLIVLDSEFWKNVNICLRAAYPLIKVLRLVDSDEPAMGFIFDAIDQAKQKIRENFNNVKRHYEQIWKIIDERWAIQLHRPLHAAGYFLNPQFHYRSDFKPNVEVKIGLYKCLDRMVPDEEEKDKVEAQLDLFKDAKGLFGIDCARRSRENKPPAKWWLAFGDECPELQKFAVRILSLTCSSSGCERNWSSFEMVHTKKRNRLQQKKMNDLVFVMCNSRMNERKRRNGNDNDADFEDFDSDNEWVAGECEEDDLGNKDHLDDLAFLDGAQNSVEEEAFVASVDESSTQRKGDDLEVDNIFDVGEDDMAIPLNVNENVTNEGTGPSGFGSNDLGHGDSGDVDVVDRADVLY